MMRHVLSLMLYTRPPLTQTSSSSRMRVQWRQLESLGVGQLPPPPKKESEKGLLSQ